MRNFVHMLIVGAGIVTGVLTAAGQVALPQAREAVLLRAENFSVDELEEIEGRFDSIQNPFYSDQPAVEESSTATVSDAPSALSDREVLDALAERINPSGVMRFGADVNLLFGERRIKPGDFISVTYQGNEYSLQLMQVNTREFSLRLNEEVISKRIR